MEVVIASSSSPGDGAISSWELSTGEEQKPRRKDCSSSPPRDLESVGGRFLTSSQSRDPSAPSGSVFYWSWEKPQVEVKSFPEEPIGPLIANKEGMFIIGEVFPGRFTYGRFLLVDFSENGMLIIEVLRAWSFQMMVLF